MGALMNINNSLQQRATTLCAFICTIALVITSITAGFAACCAPITTEVLSSFTSDTQDSPYSSSELTKLACITRTYTVEGMSHQNIYAQIAPIIRKAATDPERSSAMEQRWNRALAKANVTIDDDDTTLCQGLAQYSTTYMLDEDALSHLDDCYHLISYIAPWLIAIACAAIIMLIVIGRTDRVLISRVLTVTSITAISVILVLGIWACADFDGFFAQFHHLLFPQGNWTFDADSLLICMYPIDFWMGMGLIWLATTLLICIISAISARLLRRTDTCHLFAHHRSN
jgi:integral membrane protein (TIGR01906 family)